MSQPLVSGIIIFYNAERFFVEAIESVLAQTYGDWELLLVDDGSTDGSTEIARRYAAAHPDRVRYLEHEGHANRGMSAARNLGIKHAKGEFIAFLDADDVWVPHKLEQQVAIMQEHPAAAMCYGPTRFWYSWPGNQNHGERDWHTQHGPQVNALVEPPQLLTLLLGDEFTVPSTCSVLVRRNVTEEIGTFEESFRGQMEDMVFHTKVFYNKSVYVSSECWGWYRQHPDNNGKVAMRTGEWLPDKPNPARKAYLNWVESYLRERGAQDAELLQVLNKELFPYRHPHRYHFTEELFKPFVRRIVPEALRARMWAYLRRSKKQNQAPVSTLLQ